MVIGTLGSRAAWYQWSGSRTGGAEGVEPGRGGGRNCGSPLGGNMPAKRAGSGPVMCTRNDPSMVDDEDLRVQQVGTA